MLIRNIYKGYMMKTHNTLTPQEAAESLHAKGLSVNKWSLINGFNPQIVRTVLANKSKCRIGKSHKIAVLLGIKEGEIVD